MVKPRLIAIRSGLAIENGAVSAGGGPSLRVTPSVRGRADDIGDEILSAVFSRRGRGAASTDMVAGQVVNLAP